MELIDELYEALEQGNTEQFTQILLSQESHDLFFEIQVDHDDPGQRRTFLSAAKKALPANFIRDFKLSNNPFNLGNVASLYPDQMADLFMSLLICAVDEDDQEMMATLHKVEPKNSETIVQYLDQLGHSLMAKGEYKKSIDVIDLGLKFENNVSTTIFANALWVSQKDNTGFEIDKERNRRWLDICLKHGPENAGIFFNAACVFMEHEEYDKVIENIRNAIHYGAGQDGLNSFAKMREMTQDAMLDPIRDRVDAIFNTPPIGVNPKAWWSESDGEWIFGEKDQSGNFQGLVRYWRPGGTLVCETEHVDGQPMGKFTRYHESGEVSREGQLNGSQIVGADTAYRSYVFTSEKSIPEQAPSNVHSLETHWIDGNFSHQVLRNIDGALLTPDGDLVPERPSNVPDGAFFLANLWQSGIYSGDALKIGLWQYFDPDGAYFKEEFYSNDADYLYTILRSDRTDAAFEKGLWKGEWIGIVSLLDEHKNELGTFDSTGADLIRDPNLLQWVHEVRAINWGDLESAYTNSESIEQHLLVFGVSEDDDEREKARGHLYSFICHQGSTYEASAAAIPFLVRLSALTKHDDVKVLSLILIEHMSLIPRGKYDNWSAEGHVFECTTAVSGAAYDLIALYTLSTNDDQRIAVLNCLAGAFENPDVIRFLKTETDDVEDYAVRLAALGNFKAITPEHFASVDSMPPLLQLAVVYGAALWWDGPDHSNGLSIILDILDNQDLDASFHKFPCVEGSVIDELAFMIQPDEASITHITEKLLARLDEVHGFDACLTVASALRIVFAQEEFAISQGKVLRALVNKDDLWTNEKGEPIRLLNFIDILEEWEFPENREDLKTFSEQWATE